MDLSEPFGELPMVFDREALTAVESRDLDREGFDFGGGAAAAAV